MLPTATDPRQQLADFAHYLREHGFALGFEFGRHGRGGGF
jgi:hypothetical protein